MSLEGVEEGEGEKKGSKKRVIKNRHITIGQTLACGKVTYTAAFMLNTNIGPVY